MRINNPSTATIPRIFQDAIIIEGKVIPPQTPIMLNIYANLNNPKRWYCPDRFLPSRFSSETVEMRAWTPFGQGTRQCPARNFAMYEQSVVIAFLLRDFQWFLPRDSIHRNGLQNSFSAFALNLPDRMDIILQSINSDKLK
jgi:cytochrome P450